MIGDPNFDREALAAWVADLDRDAKASLLARVAYELTIVARDTYEPGTRGVTDPGRLRAINELMHRLTRRFLNLSHTGQDDWVEADFWLALFELAGVGGCSDDLVTATLNASRGRMAV